ncbi:uncharacterized protein P174DRAFT_430615 [Aspergillus novofumigatus IBT 16806]|uniref:Uncharacterized protein n=1 Tax=Aspergillus novofumigatus (strain IBT 16806) TaxID=1392255 RepID=A0A2I1C7J3_ASPN1|nr:uncharacterized protein P174DRAFT_430615 [Aspergillus novofumigatus IBT 16806]PKX93617.1 hypothetical protein P174DRAFT_430615 [Aspergillus novofumigatus IBT 16806]
MWESFRDLLYRNPNHRFTEDLLKTGLMQEKLAYQIKDSLRRGWYDGTGLNKDESCIFRKFRVPSKQAWNPESLPPWWCPPVSLLACSNAHSYITPHSVYIKPPQ